MSSANDSFARMHELLDEVSATLAEMGQYLPEIERDILKGQLREMYVALSRGQGSETREEPVAAPAVKEVAVEEEMIIMPRFVADEPEVMVPVAEVAVPEAAEETKTEPVLNNRNTLNNQSNQNIPSNQSTPTEVAREPAPEPEMSLFAPPEPEPEPEPTMAPVLEQIEGNTFGSLFDAIEEEPAPETTKAPAPTETPQKSEDKPAVSEVPNPAHKTEEKPKAEEKSKEKAAEGSLLDLLRKPAEGAATMTLGERLSHGTAMEAAVGNRATHSRVSDLRTIININDKFSFMSELFHNNMKAYNDFIVRLNAIEDRQEALEHVRLIAQEFQWDKESLAVQTFYSIFDRKF